MQDDHDIDKRTIKRITSLLIESAPSNYTDAVKWQRALRDAVNTAMVSRIEPIFNKELASRPHQTADERKELCSWANSQLRETLGLAIRCERTDSPARLHMCPSKGSHAGYFQIELIGQDAHRRRTLTSSELFLVRLMEWPMRRESLTSWNKRIADGGSDSSERRLR